MNLRVNFRVLILLLDSSLRYSIEGIHVWRNHQFGRPLTEFFDLTWVKPASLCWNGGCDSL